MVIENENHSARPNQKSRDLGVGELLTRYKERPRRVPKMVAGRGLPHVSGLQRINQIRCTLPSSVLSS